MAQKSTEHRPLSPVEAPKQPKEQAQPSGEVEERGLEEQAQPSSKVEKRGPKEQAQPSGENPTHRAQNLAEPVT